MCGTRGSLRTTFPAGVSVPPGEGLRKSLQTEHERQVGTKPHSLGGPAAAKITDKLTYKESFYFMTHSSVFAWKIPWTEEPGGLQSWGTEALFIPRRRVLEMSKAFPASPMGQESTQQCVVSLRVSPVSWCGQRRFASANVHI